MQPAGTLLHEVPTVHSHQLPGYCTRPRREGSQHAAAKNIAQRPKQRGGKRRSFCHRQRACSQRVVQASAQNGASKIGIAGMQLYLKHAMERSASLKPFSVAPFVGDDLHHLARAAELADSSAGECMMHSSFHLDFRIAVSYSINTLHCVQASRNHTPTLGAC